MKVAIIGAGVSGLSAGSYLQRNGFETEIFEKHAIPGGLCTSWEKDGYTFDGCAHWILGSDEGSSFHKLWSELLDLDSIRFHHHPIRMAIELQENRNKYGEKTFYFYTDLAQLKAYLLDLAPEDQTLIESLIDSISIMQRFDLPPIFDETTWWAVLRRRIRMSGYWRLLRMFLHWRKETNFTFAEKLKNPFLKESFQMLYDGAEVNMLVFTMPMAAFDKKSAGYPIGGSLRFARKIEERYLELGGKIHYHTPVRSICTRQGKATGVRVRNDVFHAADIVISAADWHWTVFEALQGKYVNQAIRSLALLENERLYYSVLQFSFGINKCLKAHPHFCRFPITDPIISPDGTHYDRFEIHIYNYDPTLAENGKTVVIVSFFTEARNFWIDLRKTDRKAYRDAKTTIGNQVKTTLQNRLGLAPDDFETTDIATPATYYRYTGNWQGSIQGWLPGKNLLHSVPVNFSLPGLQNFYYASQWNQPGGGLPIAAKNGHDLARSICRKHQRSFRSQVSR